jgi:hypothetical protein
VTSVDDTSVQLTWSGSNEAAGYRIWTRNINDGSKSSAAESIITNTSHGIGFLFPGVWNYEFCATAINGAAESSKSNCVVAPRPAGSAARSSTSSAEPPAARQAPASPAPSTSITKVTDLTKLSQSMAPSGVTAAECKELATAP